ncbi:hypothetical protein F4808DRAFT_421558 [Astrocystis sublimbata]|nr:hypothetical protein F4808DRAFT_421558 [Astrocystis sublimbata]
MESSQELERTHAGPRSEASTPKQAKKRVITAARQEQNRAAQRAYRIRQKELKAQKRSVISGPRPLRPRQDAQQDIDALRDIRTPGLNTKNETWHLSTESSSVSQDVDTPRQQDADDENQIAINSQSALDQLTYPPPASRDRDTTEISALAPIILSGNTNMHPPGLVDMINTTLGLRGSLEENSTTVFRACLSNAMCIGLDLAELVYCARPCMSPFYRPKASLTELATTSSHDSLPPCLRPTLAQILIPHHASLDLIPLPRLRERAILMCAALPHVFSLWELKLDIYTRNALVCSTAGASVSEPWDMRSWQAAPWFVSKWRTVVDADEVETSLAVPGIPGLWM